ncbi:hypothetical protein ACHAO8_010657 [Botrytis cinerea]
MAEDRLNVVIIGGSLAGLMHGAMLKQLSHNVHVLEQYPTSIRESRATGMSTGIYGRELLKKYDKIEDRPHFVTASKLEVVDARLNVTESRSVSFKLTNWKTFYYRLRANFDEFKSEYVPKPPPSFLEEGQAVVYDVGKRVTNVSYNKEAGLSVTYEDVQTGTNEVLHPDHVIAADGAGSATRKILFLDLKTSYAGFLTWRGIVPENVASKKP